MLPELKAVRELVEKQTGLQDPAERDRALADIERGLKSTLSAVLTYRGDAQVQIPGAAKDATKPS